MLITWGVHRMSAKLFKCTPEELPPDLKANLLAMLQVLHLPAFIHLAVLCPEPFSLNRGKHRATLALLTLAAGKDGVLSRGNVVAEQLDGVSR